MANTTAHEEGYMNFFIDTQNRIKNLLDQELKYGKYIFFVFYKFNY